jgi:hypothetical protein
MQQRPADRRLGIGEDMNLDQPARRQLPRAEAFDPIVTHQIQQLKLVVKAHVLYHARPHRAVVACA